MSARAGGSPRWSSSFYYPLSQHNTGSGQAGRRETELQGEGGGRERGSSPRLCSWAHLWINVTPPGSPPSHPCLPLHYDLIVSCLAPPTPPCTRATRLLQPLTHTHTPLHPPPPGVFSKFLFLSASALLLPRFLQSHFETSENQHSDSYRLVFMWGKNVPHSLCCLCQVLNFMCCFMFEYIRDKIIQLHYTVANGFVYSEVCVLTWWLISLINVLIRAAKWWFSASVSPSIIFAINWLLGQ